jgi:6-pyruvoyltetrahydropterin/6-carboxytetrahydropterin synthase
LFLGLPPYIEFATGVVLENHLDHFYLNDVPGLENPTSENIAIWLWKKLKPDLPLLHKITLHETCNSACVYSGPK